MTNKRQKVIVRMKIIYLAGKINYQVLKYDTGRYINLLQTIHFKNILKVTNGMSRVFN